MPDVEGMSLSHARTLLGLLGLQSSGVDASAAGREPEHSVQWTVVGQEPAAGTAADADEEVELRVLRRDERPGEILTMTAEEVEDKHSYDLALDYLGLTVREAQGLARSVDSELRLRDIDGDRVDDSDVEDDWVVIGQEDPPGSSAAGSVGVRVVPPSAPEADQIPERHPASWDGVTKYFGMVTGFETEDPEDHRVANVMIDDTPVLMVFIEPFDAVCEGDVDTSVAVEDRNRVLPIGTPVIATALTSGYWNEGGFVHPVAHLNPEDPVADSTNEQLVRLGSWIPDVPGVFANQFDMTTTSSPTYFTNPAAFEDLPPVARSHLLRIIDAGNSAAGLQTGSVGGCVVAAIEEARLEAEAEAERKAVMDAWLVEYQRKVDSGYFRASCRDGDGDGVCYER
ncbi:PASTA domain-containing protein [Cryobacterium sp. BB736]|uniref:PASTA domain-containing protein n=1 Tax=Cryobacterium sp. BB736 TaxID=2746963 RepID=UPI001876189C